MTEIDVLYEISKNGFCKIHSQDVEHLDFFCQKNKVSQLEFYEIIDVFKEMRLDYIHSNNPYFNPCKMFDWCINNGIEVIQPFPARPFYLFGPKRNLSDGIVLNRTGFPRKSQC